ncbi:MAG: ATP synthase F0 subunit B [Smithellaceae bacterium]|jgi:F-type H+-transporting ATPase subunit b|nr:ATP synthase F0 subunit B [Syntrophaceae bacterium]MDX9815434.1 ATP synthase F0 subunit B [Smithellaceae bacterium]OPZ54083.1 MAG: F0F1 ATP synthase subunit B [Deltaproteobacteria bacterium ADurb.BinA014]MBP8608100.1 ATP synthase F0 subunit B [Syntrophaceae bacterium]HNV64902.1 ATP synthase F0 subunit B [Smithellaceae bacterium]
MVQVLPDLTFFVQMAIFLVLVFVLNALLYKPILNIIDRRKKQLEELENEIKLFNESVNTKAAEYEEKLKQAKTNAAELKKEIIQEGNEQAKKIVDVVRAEIPVMTQEFQQKIGKEIQTARQILDKQSQKLSLDIAQKVLGRSVK